MKSTARRGAAAAVLACALVAGCTTGNRVEPETMQIATAPLVCRADQCAVWWARARQWVTQHAQYPLQTDTADEIDTAGPAGGSGAPAFQVTRARNPDGSFTIGFAAHCDRPLAGCRPDPWQSAAGFKQFVRSGAQAPSSAQPAQAQSPQQ